MSLLFALSACQRTDAVVVDGGPDAAEGEGEGEGEPIVDACPDDVCDEGCADTIDGLCLPARIAVDEPFTVTTSNEVCVGSTCTLVFPSVCSTRVEGNRVVVEGSVCAQHDDRVTDCSEDCGGNSGGTCELPGLAAGTYTLVVGERQLALTVPLDGAGTDGPCL